MDVLAGQTFSAPPSVKGSAVRAELHEALRTTFRRVVGEPEPRIAPAEESGFLLLEHDLSGHAEPAASPDEGGSVRVPHTRFTRVPRS